VNRNKIAVAYSHKRVLVAERIFKTNINYKKLNKMNEKEKALELVKYFFSKIIRDKNKIIAIPLVDAKEYALRMVDEVLKQQPYDVYTMEQCDNVNMYWNNVKKEIDSL